ncbi:hypothetical protein Vretimale_5377 [Volvox reticuliferus]|nr:hypothetical protein Vretifemale_3870 [Volvox reticuliferus]GIM00227.1 hypothetical protein Vretimale_5377 [Volvox reticuliferus]
MPPPKLPEGTATEASTSVPADAPSIQSLPAATGPPKCQVPDWAVEPTAGSRLLVYKDGQVIQEVPLVKIVTVFGRVDALADVVLDHPSISRQHATAAFHGARGTWMITDLGSTHGTFLGDRPLAKNEPTELVPGVELRFAASTRRYKLPPAPPGPQSRTAALNAGVVAAAAADVPGSGSGDVSSGTASASAREMPPPPPPKRPRVCFADDADAGGHNGGSGEDVKPAMSAAAGRPRQLENIIGFSDGRDFVARVGPRAAAPAEGRFAGAVATTIVLSPKGPPASAAMATTPRASSIGSGDAVVSGGGSSPRPPSSAHGGAGAGAGATATTEVRPQLRQFVDRIRKEIPRGGGGTLYEQLPPPSR